MLPILVKHYLVIGLVAILPCYSVIGDDHILAVAFLKVECLVHEGL